MTDIWDSLRSIFSPATTHISKEDQQKGFTYNPQSPFDPAKDRQVPDENTWWDTLRSLVSGGSGMALPQAINGVKNAQSSYVAPATPSNNIMGTPVGPNPLTPATPATGNNYRDRSWAPTASPTAAPSVDPYLQALQALTQGTPGQAGPDPTAYIKQLRDAIGAIYAPQFADVQRQKGGIDANAKKSSERVSGIYRDLGQYYSDASVGANTANAKDEANTKASYAKQVTDMEAQRVQRLAELKNDLTRSGSQDSYGQMAAGINEQYDAMKADLQSQGNTQTDYTKNIGNVSENYLSSGVGMSQAQNADAQYGIEDQRLSGINALESLLAQMRGQKAQQEGQAYQTGQDWSNKQAVQGKAGMNPGEAMLKIMDSKRADETLKYKRDEVYSKLDAKGNPTAPKLSDTYTPKQIAAIKYLQQSGLPQPKQDEIIGKATAFITNNNDIVRGQYQDKETGASARITPQYIIKIAREQAQANGLQTAAEIEAFAQAAAALVSGG